MDRYGCLRRIDAAENLFSSMTELEGHRWQPLGAAGIEGTARLLLLLVELKSSPVKILNAAAKRNLKGLCVWFVFFCSAQVVPQVA